MVRLAMVVPPAEREVAFDHPLCPSLQRDLRGFPHEVARLAPHEPASLLFELLREEHVGGTIRVSGAGRLASLSIRVLRASAILRLAHLLRGEEVVQSRSLIFHWFRARVWRDRFVRRFVVDLPGIASSLWLVATLAREAEALVRIPEGSLHGERANF